MRNIMSGRKHIHIIVNPYAGSRSSGLFEAVLEILERAGADVTVEETNAPGHATVLAYNAASIGRADVVAAAGGDGTINEAACGLQGFGTPMGIIPLGTANVLAIEIGLKVKAEAVAETLLYGEAKLVGTGDVNGDLFLLMVGVGFDGRIVHRIDPDLKRLTGKGAFVWAGLCEWLRGPGCKLEVVADGKPEEAYWAIVTNARHYAGAYSLAPEADIGWPGLDLFLFRKGGRLAFAGYLLALGLGRMEKLKSVTKRRVRRVDFLGPEGLDVEADGDCRGTLPKSVTQGNRFLRLVMPRPSVRRGRMPSLR